MLQYAKIKKSRNIESTYTGAIDLIFCICKIKFFQKYFLIYHEDL